ncbi:MAG TPA: hypothetical protein VFE50_06070, partial [Cyclobacteriaceae bacterium]|nr:hypothetical protein [Cyclobacteriaceae bacterium]
FPAALNDNQPSSSGAYFFSSEIKRHVRITARWLSSTQVFPSPAIQDQTNNESPCDILFSSQIFHGWV